MSERNRSHSPLPILEIRVLHRDGIETTDPNGVVASAVYGATGQMPQFVAVKQIIKLRELRPRKGTKSIVSGKPALICHTHNDVAALSHDEMHRLFDRNLTPEEYFTIRNFFGIFHEIHEDFYDPASGTALQAVTGMPLML